MLYLNLKPAIICLLIVDVYSDVINLKLKE